MSEPSAGPAGWSDRSAGPLGVLGVSRRTLATIAACVLLALVAIFLMAKWAGEAHRDAATPSTGPIATAATPISGLPTVRLADLPSEAQDMLALIDKGGPYRYSQDGVVFGNFERLLPDRPRGYYHEYTVVTPGLSNRGTRRLVVGQLGDVYYTNDHYESFRQVLR